tara:strand:- start:38 stop:1300 length:1263 start_codon:yes stop_codon:yes gene_type:complete
MSKLIEKIDLLGRLKDLQENLDENHGSYRLVKKYTDLLETYKDYAKLDLNKMIREFNAYNWMDSFSNFITEFYKEVNSTESRITLALESAIANLKYKNRSNSFTKSIELLSDILENEKFDISDLYKVLESHLWIPEIKSIILTAEDANKSVTKVSENANASTPYSPVFEDNGSYTFNLNGKWYSMNESELTQLDKKSSSIEKMYLDVISKFKVVEGVFTMFHKKNKIEVSINEDSNELRVNGTLVEGDINTYLMSTGTFRVDELHLSHLVEFAAKNVNNIVELDFVSSLQSKNHRGVTANVIKVEESLYLNKVNEAMMENTLEKFDSAKSLVESVNDFVSYDISNFILESIESEKSFEGKIANHKAVYEDRINFLNDQLSELAKLEEEIGSDSNEIKEAKKILLDSINEQKALLNELIKK